MNDFSSLSIEELGQVLLAFGHLIKYEQGPMYGVKERGNAGRFYHLDNATNRWLYLNKLGIGSDSSEDG